MPIKRHDDVTALGALALVGQLGLAVALPVVCGVIAGVYLDRWAGGHGALLVAAVLLGVAGGVFGAYRLLAKEMKWRP